MRAAVAGGVWLIAFLCAVVTIVIPVIPYAVFVAKREIELNQQPVAEPERRDEITYLRARNVCSFGACCTATFFLLGYWLVTYAYHLLTDGRWNTWALM